MLSNDQTITLNAVARTLKRVAFGDRKGEFEDSTNGLKLLVAHTVGKRARRVVKLTQDKIVADPYVTGLSKPISLSISTTIDAPLLGFTPVDVEKALKALADWLAVQANRDAIVNGES